MYVRPLIAALGLAALALAGCPDARTRAGPEPVFEDVPIHDATAVDMLVVVDNSNSMPEEQAVLAEQADVLFRALVAPTPGEDGALPPASDLHVGVVTTDMGSGGYMIQTCSNPMNGDNGVLQNAGRLEECQDVYSADYCGREVCPWLDSSADSPNDGTDGTPAIWEDFGCIATLGWGGCGLEQHLESSLMALTVQTDPGKPNEGFLRDDSLLTVVYVTDEDDCSSGNAEMYNPSSESLGCFCTRCVDSENELYPVSRYHDGFVGLRGGDAERVVVAVIAGVPLDGTWDAETLRAIRTHVPENPNVMVHSCRSDLGAAFPPVRLAELAESFGDNGVLASICQEDWSDALSQTARTIQSHLGVACVDLPDGVDPAADCRLVEVLGDGSAREVPHADSDPGGWSIAMDSEACPDGQLQIGSEPLAAEGYRFECASHESGDES